MSKSANPLKQYFRQPAIYLRLPSGGNFWPTGSLAVPPNQELPVLPMTAIDEVTYRTPDALFNGSAVVNVIQSCIPSIQNAWVTPGIDLNAILVAIRIASYGHDMEIDSTCPSCNHQGEYTIDLRLILDSLATASYTEPLHYGDLEMSFQPMSYQVQNATNQTQFDRQRQIQAVTQSDMPEEQKIEKLNEALIQISEMTISALKHSIASIRTPQAIVTEPEHIEEFLNNCDRALFVKLRDHIVKLRETSEFKPLNMRCSECDHEYSQQLTLDQVSFFGLAS
jgi:hypothetical protein